jgi:AraC-like DNA-binding protein
MMRARQPGLYTAILTAVLNTGKEPLAVSLVLRAPPPSLAPYVARLWWYEGPIPSHARELMLPTAAPQLVVNLRRDVTLVGRATAPQQYERLRGAVLGGAYDEPFVIPTAQQAACAGVAFHPGGAVTFLGGLPASELRNSHVSLDTLWGDVAAHLAEQLAAAPTPAAGLAVLESVLMRQRRPNSSSHPVVTAALAALKAGAYRRPIWLLAAELGVSQQCLGQLFREQVGLTPKQLARVWRFQTALRLLHTAPMAGWAERALACGYVDQSHLVRDFRAFTGVAPTAFQARWGGQTNHLPLG